METHFTQRELTVIYEFVKGKTNCEIAQALFISPATVKYYLSEILKKTNCENRIKLLIYLLSTEEGKILLEKVQSYISSL